MNMKKIIAVVLASAAVLSLAGCGSKETSTSVNTPASKTSSTSSKPNTTSIAGGTSSTASSSGTSSTVEGASSVTDSKPEESSAASISTESQPEESKPEEIAPEQVDWSTIPEINEKDIEYTVEEDGRHVLFDNVPEEERDKLKDGCVVIKKYKGDAEYIKIPQTIAGKSNIAVVGVDWGKNAKAIKFPDGISFSVYNSGTGTAPNVTSISLPDTVEYIQGFSGLKAIEEITLPKDLKTVGKTTFFKLEKLKKVTFGEKVEGIGVSAFSGCSGLEKITLPDSVSSVGSSAFNGCTNVEINFKGKTYNEENVKELYGKDLSTM